MVNCVQYLTCMGHYTLCKVSKKMQFKLSLLTKGQTISGYSHIQSELISGITVSTFLETINFDNEGI